MDDKEKLKVELAEIQIQLEEKQAQMNQLNESAKPLMERKYQIINELRK